MRIMLGWGERLGGWTRAPRLYYAALPFAIPLIIATAAPVATVDQREASPAPAPRIDFSMLEEPAAALPSHSIVLPIDHGDTLGTILVEGGLSHSETAGLVSEFSRSIDPRRLRLGDLVNFRYAADGVVEQVAMKISGWGEIRARRNEKGFDVIAEQAPLRKETVRVSARIESSLYDAVRGAGESPQLVQKLVDVFQWDVDFFALRRGDSFSIVIEKMYAGDEPTGYGPVLAARFRHRDQQVDAYRFDSAGGSHYYTASGSPVRKQFLKAPLRFSRVTSGFTKRRFHPILGIFRPHHGVDYGAPAGTPVMSTADGVVVFAGGGKGEGNFVRIRHSARIETYYLHLSRFAKGIKPGARVSQGDVIGYVGATGLATAPHLDYRISDKGTWLDPLKMKSITPDPLRGVELRRFQANVGRWSSLLATDEVQVADDISTESQRAFF
ncbi:MAG TPA: peptidoglycan DD-metalloendopeptidase family protein [Thermoanaerobaculia bacterium]|nr:peptidoglycan DD-metalloendopeptidase family protein [Thermoanaerobaculia bacterium]